MIRRALGLGLMILILRFLMKEVFAAFENTAVSVLNVANILISKLGTTTTQLDINNLIPR
jgi:hypothetical protein